MPNKTYGGFYAINWSKYEINLPLQRYAQEEYNTLKK
ncbi:MAG: hypothetical protein ACI9SJ_000229 [Flavobacteriaceae bacterium]|jgi:hypothetical protein